MPLNRDQAPDNSGAKSASIFVASRQHSRTRELEHDRNTRPSTPSDDAQKHQRRSSNNSNAGRPNAKHQLAEGSEDVLHSLTQGYKMHVQNTIPLNTRSRPPQPAFSKAQVPITKHQVTEKAVKNEKFNPQNRTAFDETTSLDWSSFNDPDNHENQTAILDPQPTLQVIDANGHADRFGYGIGVEEQGGYNTQEEVIALCGEDWEDQVSDQRRYLTQKKGYDNNRFAVRSHAARSVEQSKYQSRIVPDENRQPETPSRTQSAPPVKLDLYAPVPLPLKVKFNPANQVHNLSPEVRSSEMASEDGSDLLDMRRSSVSPPVPKMHVHPEVQQQQRTYVQGRQSQSHTDLTSHSDRFRQLRGSLQSSVQESQKVSAPESDVQDLSEDEQAQTNPKDASQNIVSANIGPLKPSTGKRPHEEISNGLDYSDAELEKKSLPDLQSEPFTRDPNSVSGPTPIDSVGNEMTLSQILENLSKVSVDAQRGTLRSLSDEQWAQTGQWFVDKFQADLRDLSNARLERRKIALKYEDKIRRRQCLVEYHEADVDKELNALQAGGHELVKARKVPGGSRAGTPMKNSR